MNLYVHPLEHKTRFRKPTGMPLCPEFGYWTQRKVQRMSNYQFVIRQAMFDWLNECCTQPWTIVVADVGFAVSEHDKAKSRVLFASNKDAMLYKLAHL